MCFPPSDALPSPILSKPRRGTFPSLPDRHSLHQVSRPQRHSFLHEFHATSHKRGVQPQIRRGCSFSIELDQTFEANRLGVHYTPTSRSEGSGVVEPDWGEATRLWGSGAYPSQISQQQSQWLPSLFSNPKETGHSPSLPPASPPETRSDLLPQQVAEARERPAVVEVGFTGFTERSETRRNSICSNSSEERAVIPTQEKRLRQRTRARLGARGRAPQAPAAQLSVHAVKVTHSLAASSAKRMECKPKRPSLDNIQATRSSQQQPRATSQKTSQKSATKKVRAAEADAYCCAVPASETDSDNDWDVGPWNAICSPHDSTVPMCVDEFPHRAT